MKRIYKILFICILTIFCLNIINFNVYAEVNHSYSDVKVWDINTPSSGDSVVKGITSTILDYVAKFIFVVAQLVEKLVTYFSKWVFGVEEFPWEDLIVFNSLPYLDVNFFNASKGSIFNNAAGTVVGDSIKSVYFSLLTLAVGILGIGVAITAIRLAISSIAAEKAKYKEAITKCLYTVVMLFSVHILLAFIFYLNETICEAASKMLQKIVSDQQLNEMNKVDTDEFWDFFNYNANSFNTIAHLRTDGGFWAGMWKVGTNYLQSGSTVIQSSDLEKKYNELLNRYNSLSSKYPKFSKTIAYIGNNGIYQNSRFYENEGNSLYYFTVDANGNAQDNKHWDKQDSPDDPQKAMDLLLDDAEKVVKAKSISELKKKFSGETNKEYYEVLEDACKIYTLEDWDIDNIISNLGKFFKEEGYKIKAKGYDDMEVISVILYSVLLVQSLMLLISYIRRLFYVTLLSIMAPIVVIYDFFISAI